MSVFVIAEIGQAWVYTADWRENFEHAHQAIEAAKDAGADAIKFQWTSDGAEMAQRRKVNDPQAYWRLLWPEPWLTDFSARAQQHGLEFMCSVFIPKDVAKVAPYLRRYKVASLECQDRALRQAIAKYQKPVIVSTGCCDEDEFTSLPWWDVVEAKILHCTAAYPCPPEEMHLRILDGVDGLSDHSGNVQTGGFAVIRGAEIIEVHMRLDRTPQSNPDYPHSHPPKQLAKYIANVRLAEAMMAGEGVKRVTPSEQPLVKHKVVTT